MRSLLVAAAGVAIGLLHQATGGPHVDTILTRPGTISAFAQDDQLIAWFTPGKSCNTVHVASLVNPLRTTLPQQAGAVNVTCRWRVGSTPVRLALAGDRAAWTLRQASPISFDYLIGASVSSRKERRFQEFAHTKVGAGLWLGGVTGDHDTLAYAIAVPEMLYVSSQIWSDELNVPVMMNVLLICYFLLVGILVYVMHRWERALHVPGFGA